MDYPTFWTIIATINPVLALALVLEGRQLVSNRLIDLSTLWHSRLTVYPIAIILAALAALESQALDALLSGDPHASWAPWAATTVVVALTTLVVQPALYLVLFVEAKTLARLTAAAGKRQLTLRNRRLRKRTVRSLQGVLRGARRIDWLSADLAQVEAAHGSASAVAVEAAERAGWSRPGTAAPRASLMGSYFELEHLVAECLALLDDIDRDDAAAHWEVVRRAAEADMRSYLACAAGGPPGAN